MAKTIICNMCGKEFNFWDEQNLFSIHRRMGYGTKYDNDILEFDLCCECMDELIEKCKVSPIKPRVETQESATETL